jgi:hypothetical protein
MRVNVYAEEITDRIEIISKETADGTFTGLRMFLELPVTLADGKQVSGPFMHHPGDDDSAAITFWGKRNLREALIKSILMLDLHYEKQASDLELSVKKRAARVKADLQELVCELVQSESDRERLFRVIDSYAFTCTQVSRIVESDEKIQLRDFV